MIRTPAKIAEPVVRNADQIGKTSHKAPATRYAFSPAKIARRVARNADQIGKTPPKAQAKRHAFSRVHCSDQVTSILHNYS